MLKRLESVSVVDCESRVEERGYDNTRYEYYSYLVSSTVTVPVSRKK
jgi:hypothetical protein